jgi:hypothetical protein
MADKDGRVTFPLIPATHWWSLRKRFNVSIPTKVDARYLSTALNMTESSAQNNIIPALRKMKLIDDDNKPTDLVKKWRDDAAYPAVCDEIRKSTYPKELFDVAPDPLGADKEAARRWFKSHGAGEALTNKALATYILLVEADPAKANTEFAPKPKGNNPKESKRPAPKADSESKDKTKHEQQPPRSFAPQLHLNVQVHISPETTPDQIEAIFASMAKHLKTMSE